MSDAAIASGAQILAEHGIPDPRREARKLWEASFPRRYVDYEAAMAGGREVLFFELIQRRAAREPMSHLLGYRDFWEHRFEVSGDVLDPRPDTETLVDAVLGRVDHNAPLKLLDMGTGSGAILLALLAELPLATGLGTDISTGALDAAARNAAANGLQDRAEFRLSSWADGLDDRFDVIVSNPPYIPSGDIATLAPEVREHDPLRALDGGADGLDCYRQITADLAKIAAPGALVALEIGIGQADDVCALLAAQNVQGIEVLQDFGGIDRVIVARMSQ